MNDMRHRGLSLLEHIDRFFATYGYKPSAEEKQLHLEWAKGLDENLLLKVLDTDHHNVAPSGQAMRPNLPTLKAIGYKLRGTDPRFMPQDAYEPQEPLGCLYCCEQGITDSDHDSALEKEINPFLVGNVHDIQLVDGVWQDVVIGECFECTDGGAQPSEPIRKLAEKWNVSCAQVIAELLLHIFASKLKSGEYPEGNLTQIIDKWLTEEVGR